MQSEDIPRNVDFDERRVIMLKAHNTQLVKQVAFLQELCTKQSGLVADCNSVLADAAHAATDEDS
jgi:hypothetical protein